MKEKQLPLAHFTRYLWQEPNLIVVLGEMGPIEAGRQSYQERHGITESDPAEEGQIVRLMAGAGLALVSSPKLDSWGWTLTLENFPYGLFCGAEPRECSVPVAARLTR